MILLLQTCHCERLHHRVGQNTPGFCAVPVLFRCSTKKVRYLQRIAVYQENQSSFEKRGCKGLHPLTGHPVRGTGNKGCALDSPLSAAVGGISNERKQSSSGLTSFN